MNRGNNQPQGDGQQANPRNNNGVEPLAQNPQHHTQLGRNSQLQINHMCAIYITYGHYTHQFPHLTHVQQLLQNDSQRDPNAAAPT